MDVIGVGADVLVGCLVVIVVITAFVLEEAEVFKKLFPENKFSSTLLFAAFLLPTNAVDPLLESVISPLPKLMNG
jgi:hypothetical protein